MKHSTIIEGLIVVGLIGVSVWVVSVPGFVTSAATAMATLGAWGYLVFVGLLVAAVVLAPVVVLPLIPLAAQVFGPFMAAVLSVVGWTIGSVIAFLLARHIGRPLLERFVSFAAVDRLAAQVPPTAHFWFIFWVRHVLPVDVVSYALGFVPSVSFLTYTSASFLGVVWFSFAFAYLGDAFFSGNVYILLEIGLVSVFIFVVAWYIVRTKSN